MLKLENTACNHHAAAAAAANNWILSPRREREWLCEACDRAPAVFLCKSDAASLCAACDADIHSVNPLARRHHRVPIVPGMFCGVPSAPPPPGNAEDETVDEEEEDEDEAVSWLLLNPVKNGDGQCNDNDPTSFCGLVDEYLDLDDYNSCQNSQFINDDQFNNQQQHYNGTVAQNKSYGGGDSVVPIQLGLDYDSSNAGYLYPASMSHTVSLSPLDVGVVPESTMSENSISIPLIQMPSQLSAMDRKARVLRYREKKKTRKFEKTIRYASRKAYAETRPRIKGRFANSRDVEVEVDQMFSASVMAESGYGIVPSF